MGELTLIHGPAHPDKQSPLFEHCLRQLKQGKSGDFLWLFPTHFQAQLMHRQLMRASGAGIQSGHSALDLTRFIATLYRLCPDQRPTLPPSAQRLLVEDTIAANAAVTPYFSRRPDGLGRGLTQLFRTLEEAGTLPDDLRAEDQRSTELTILYTAYLERLNADWASSTERFTVVADRLNPTMLKQQFPDLELLICSNFSAVPAPFKPVLQRLVQIVPKSIAILDYEHALPRLFNHARPLYYFLNDLASSVEPSANTSTQYPAAVFAQRLFVHERDEIPAPVDRVACFDRHGEVTQIARRIRRLLQNGDTDLSQVRICFRNLDHYAPLIAEVLPRHGLPFYLSQGPPLSTTPVVGAVLALVDLVLERYSRPALLRLLCLPWFKLRFIHEGRSLDLSPADFDAWARNLPPTIGRRAWLEAIGGRCAYLERELNQSDNPLSEEIDDPLAWRDSLRGDLEALKPLQRGLTVLFDLLRPFERRQDLPSFCRHLLHALNELGLCEKLAMGKADADPADGQAFTRLLKLFEELCAPAAAQQPRTLSDLCELLRDAISHAYLPAHTPNGIQVCSLTAAGAPCDYLFLGGLVQGEFPRQSPSDIFLDEGQRRALGKDENAATDGDRLLFYQTLCAARRGLCVLYPQHAGTAVLSPSSFIAELDDLLAPSASPETTDSPSFTTTDLHLTLGQGLCDDDDSDRAQTALPLYAQANQDPAHGPRVRRLLRGLQIADARSDPEGLGAYEGLLDGQDLLDSLRSRLGSGHAFSTTQLETYGRCPFRYFAHRLLNISPLHDPEADDSALERGNLVHRILYQFYSEYGEAAEREENLARGITRLRQIGREIAVEMHLEGFFWERELERLLGNADGLGREGIVPRFLQLQAASANPAVPTHFELSFGSYPGMGPRDPHSSSTAYAISDPETGAEVRLFGKIDRVDRTADGRFIVFDYKTGREPRVAEIAQGLNLQLPLYLLAVESLLGEAGLQEGVGGAYLLLRDLENCGRRGLFADEGHRNTAYVAHGKQGLYNREEYRQLLEAVRGYVLSYARAMRRGVYHVTPHNPANTCPGCPYAQSCRLDPRRMRSLNRTEKLP
ncbi:MAG TPA: PD-(D/E)XK nuclease family protein [Candidatus Handelsmanbacteria bacterium]|nr:PD-(D/E)XK nuclease family protein [Candidatus Handelsmanbacteria bacterium]